MNITTHRIRILSSDVARVEAFYDAVRALDEIISPTSNAPQHLALAGEFDIDMSQWLDLYTLDEIDLKTFADDYDLHADLGIVILLGDPNEEELAIANRIYQAARVYAHVPTLIAAHCPDTLSEDTARFGVDLLLDDDPIYCYDYFSAEHIRQMLIRLLDEVVRIRDEYPLEINDLLTMLLDEA